MTSYTIEEAVTLLTVAARTRGRKVLLCGQGVLDAITQAVPPSRPPIASMPGMALLMGVDITLDPAMESGQFSLVHHDCEVIGLEVSHGRCVATAKGILTPAPEKP